MNLKIAEKVEVKMTEFKGYGVFATQPIKKDELVEECHLITICTRRNFIPLLYNYIFRYPKGDNWEEVVIPLGYGSIYNHSNTPHANWKESKENKTFLFYALRDIEIGEEICTYYGGEEWWATRNILMK